jgi:hypothetical protein
MCEEVLVRFFNGVEKIWKITASSISRRHVQICNFYCQKQMFNLFLLGYDIVKLEKIA